MKKQHTSMKYCKNFRHVYNAGYCDLQRIMTHFEPQFYNAGVNGWNCDLYVDYSRDLVITTGYRNMRGTHIPYELIQKYDAKASDIIHYSHDLDNDLDALREEFFDALIKEVD